jgi:hypothetical protein
VLGTHSVLSKSHAQVLKVAVVSDVSAGNLRAMLTPSAIVLGIALSNRVYGQSSAPSGSAPVKKVELPEGEGKPIATEFCQDCHRLTNLTNAQMSADD